MDQDLDNNNGPISPADLENIENNNAVDYIPNRNEIGNIQDNSNFTINRSLTENVPIYSTPNSSTQSTNIINQPLSHHQHPRDLDSPSSSSVSMIQQQIESQPSPPSPIALPIPINEIECRVVNVCSNYHNPFVAASAANDITINMDQPGSSLINPWSTTSRIGTIETQHQNPYVDYSVRHNCSGNNPLTSSSRFVPGSGERSSLDLEDDIMPRESQNTLNNNNATLDNNLVNKVEEKNEFFSVYIEGE